MRCSTGSGQVDLLCNNAGVFVGGLIWDRPAEDFEFVLGANLWGILNGIRAFVPRMLAQGTEGHVVNTSSVAGLLGAPFEAPYAVSKFAAFAATESWPTTCRRSARSSGPRSCAPGWSTPTSSTRTGTGPSRLATEFTEDQKFVTDYLGQAVAPAWIRPRWPDGDGGHPERGVPDPDPRRLPAGAAGPGRALVARRLPDVGGVRLRTAGPASVGRDPGRGGSVQPAVAMPPSTGMIAPVR